MYFPINILRDGNCPMLHSLTNNVMFVYQLGGWKRVQKHSLSIVAMYEGEVNNLPMSAI